MKLRIEKNSIFELFFLLQHLLRVIHKSSIISKWVKNKNTLLFSKKKAIRLSNIFQQKIVISCFFSRSMKMKMPCESYL